MNGSRWAGFVLVVLLSVMFGVAAHAELDMSGYAQARFDVWDGDLSSDDDEFDLRRVRVKIAGPVNDDGTEIKLQVDLGGLDDDGGDEVVLKDATISRPIGEEWSVKVGFADVEFGNDLVYSSSKRLPFERARITRKLFPGEKTTGIWFDYKPATGNAPELTLSYNDDLKDWASKNKVDVDDSDAFTVRLQWPLENKGSAGVSYMNASRSGDDGGTPFDYSNAVLGAHVRWNGSNGLNFQGEYCDGEIGPYDVSGWLGLVEYRPEASGGTFFYRYDTYDDGHSADDYAAHTLGYAYELGKDDLLTLQIEDISAESGASGTNFGLQWQVKY